MENVATADERLRTSRRTSGVLGQAWASLVAARWAPLAVVAIAFFSFGLIGITDPDYWWHLRTGHLIVDSHAIPRVDPYSFTLPGKAWVAHEWLAEVLIYGLQSAGGYAANVIFFVAAAI